MRHDAPFVIKRLSPMIGRSTSARRMKVHGRAYTLADALEIAVEPTRRRRTLQARLDRDGDAIGWIVETIRELKRTAIWIEHRDAPASITRRQAAKGESSNNQQRTTP
jgi:hypothetical protein